MDIDQTLEQLDLQLREVIVAEPLEALKTIGRAERNLADQRRDAVRAAAPKHSWAEIGEALGVSRQAAHHKFAKEWAETLKGEVKAAARAEKQAARHRQYDDAAKAAQARDAAIAEIKQMSKAQRRRRKRG